MSESTNTNGGLAFILGAVVVVLAGLVWFVATGGDIPGGDHDAEIKIDLPGKN